MKLILALIVFVVVMLVLAFRADAHLVTRPPANAPVERIQKSQITNLAHARYVARNGRGRKVPWHRQAAFRPGWLAAELAETNAVLRARQIASLSPSEAICRIFGGYCSQALYVAFCESRYDPGAVNGQYLGLFQMGASERATYGHSSTALGQAQAAYRYFDASGRDWSPWDSKCQP